MDRNSEVSATGGADPAEASGNGSIRDGLAETATRRRVLAKIGVGGAVLWAAPVVTTLDRSAAAEGSPDPQTTTTTTTQQPVGPVLDFDQSVNPSGYRTLDSGTGPNQVWQPFVAGRSGDLVELAVWTRISAAGAGPLAVAIHAADPTTGYPVGQPIGSGQLAEPAPQPAPMPGTAKTITLSTPAPIVTGSTYVAVFSRPTTSNIPWELWFGPLTGFPYISKLWYVDDPQPGSFTLYLRTWVL